MPPPQFSVDEYVTKVKMSNQPTLLVEGPTDEQFFLLLRDSMRQAGNIQDKEVFIDTAAIIGSSEVLGNRAKVEKVTGMITSREFSARFVGFVDREFREFNIEDVLSDNLQQHNQIGRLVWSLGHSIENYFFEYSLMREPLRRFSTSSHFSVALDQMEERFQDVMNIACALSLAVKDVGLLGRWSSIVDWTCFKLTDSILELDSKLWVEYLESKIKLDGGRTNRLLERFEHWLNVSINSGPTTVRQLCHGHIGLSVIWKAYARFIHDASSSGGEESPQTHVSNVLGSEQVRSNVCAAELAEQSVKDDSLEVPLICFRLLGVVV